MKCSYCTNPKPKSLIIQIWKKLYYLYPEFQLNIIIIADNTLKTIIVTEMMTILSFLKHRDVSDVGKYTNFTFCNSWKGFQLRYVMLNERYLLFNIRYPLKRFRLVLHGALNRWRVK